MANPRTNLLTMKHKNYLAFTKQELFSFIFTNIILGTKGLRFQWYLNCNVLIADLVMYWMEFY